MFEKIVKKRLDPICKQCQQSFEILSSDFAFYDKISPVFNDEKYSLPPPTLCLDCRLQRRLAWRNEFKLYKRSCDFSKKNIISIYAPDSAYKVYSPEVWWSDHWDALTFGRDFDFQRGFFEQFSELLKNVPRLSLMCKQSENCDYCHNTLFSKNCYLSTLSLRCEDCLYTYDTIECRDAIDGLHLFKCERCYECINCRECYESAYLQDCENCANSLFCFDCKQLSSCFGCKGLQHKQYCIFNKQVSKAQYEQFIAKLGSHSFMELNRNKFETFKKTLPYRFAKIIGTEGSSGDHIYFSKNCMNCYEVENGEDLTRVYLSKNLKDSMDVYGARTGGELQYECSAAAGSTNILFSYFSWHCHNGCYLNYCQDCKDVFGCVSLKKKQYCILNKQYSKEEYHVTMGRILNHMKKTGEWGEFFPVSISPYAYNESVAYHYFPLAKESVLARGWKWKPEGKKEPVKQTFSVPDDIRDVSESITSEILTCATCSKNFRITLQELRLYRSLMISIPEKCYDCRHIARIAQKNPRKLWNRPCSKCSQNIQTTYSPQKPEIVYCDSCYLASIY